MGTAIATLISFALVILAMGIIAQGTFKSAVDLWDAWSHMEVLSGDIARTQVRAVSVTHSPPLIDLTLENSGQQSLLDLSQWDVVLQYYEPDGTYHQVWLPYTSSASPADNQWTVTGIYLDAETSKSEVYQPNVFDPGEEMVIRVKISPAATDTPGNMIVVGTANGVSVSLLF